MVTFPWFTMINTRFTMKNHQFTMIVASFTMINNWFTMKNHQFTMIVASFTMITLNCHSLSCSISAKDANYSDF
jgi:hypothetical protein